MSGDRGRDDDPPEIPWAGRFIEVRKRGDWEYAARTRDIRAVAILALDSDAVILIEQYRVPLGQRSLELPAGLVGDHDARDTITAAAARELEEETGYRASRLDVLGEFQPSPGMVSEAFTLVRATGLSRVGAGGGVDGEDIVVHRVPLDQVPAFVDTKRAEGVAIDVRLLPLLAANYLKLSE